MVKKENGGGIDYSVYIVAIFVVTVLVYFLTYQQKLIVVKELLKNELQMCENHVLTFAQPQEGTSSDILDVRERNRSHIIVDYTNAEGLPTAEELGQIGMIALEFERKINERFKLDTNNIPQGNTLAELCAGKLTISSFIIYEAVYNNRREIENYIVYDVSIMNGTFSCAAKKIIPANSELGGRKLRGSTIYAKLDYHILSPNKISLGGTEAGGKYSVSVETCVDIVLHKNYS